MSFLRIIPVLALMFLLPASVKAEEDTAPEKPAQNEAPVKPANPYMEELKQKAVTLDEALSAQEKERMVKLRNAFGMLRSMALVKESVAEAVKVCGHENPDMKEEITGHFEEWKNRVEPVQEKQEEKLESVIAKPYFSKPGAVKEYLATVDKAARYADDQYKAEPVSDEASCRKLIESMDDTGDKLVALLGEIPWPEKPEQSKTE